MAEADLASRVAELLAVDRAAFEERVAEGADFIAGEVDDGTFDNPQGSVGLECEFYAVTADSGERWTEPTAPSHLARVPRRLLEYVGVEKELGLHNAEFSTRPQPMNAHGLRAQAAEMRARLETAREPMRAEGLRLVSDGVWTIPPAGETSPTYLGDVVEREGLRLATNMSDSARYHAMSNAGHAGMEIDVPGVEFRTETVLPESLTTSVQPHFQVPHARDLPTLFGYALRVAGPLLALAVNSPVLPPDLYDDPDPETVLAEAPHEHRVPVFETVMNPAGEDAEPKVRFPRDVETVEEALDRVVADPTIVAADAGGGDRFDDAFAAFRYKHGTFWRWVRPVFEGATRSEAHARIEFRPLPGQPTVRDTVAFQAAFAGLLVSLDRSEHPVRRLDWQVARENFYRAVQDGVDADLRWLSADGEETTDSTAIFEELLDHAAAGLRARGFTERAARRRLEPLAVRVEASATPASWKREHIAEGLSEGRSFEEAVTAAQRAYVDRQAETLLDGSFADWL
jgi:hypothetical protein